MKRLRGSATASVAVIVTAAVLMSGCGGGAATQTLSGEVDPSAILRVSSAAPTRNLDPHLQATFGGVGYLVPIFDRLTVVDSDDNLQPGLAESWEFAPDGAYLELKLRQGVTFHDGTPFDASAVAANIERGKTMEGSTVVTVLKSISGVEVVDDHTVRLRLEAGVGAELPGVLSSNAGMMISPKAIAAGTDIRSDPGLSGTGAYVVKRYVPEESLSLVRAEGTNWDPEAGKLAGMELTWIADASTRLNGLRTGATDLSWVSSASEVVAAKSLADTGALELNEVPFRTLLGVSMRSQGDLAKPEVRQAVASAIDPAAISALFSDLCTPNRQFYPAGSWPADPTYRYPYEFDLEKARSLVQAAGGAKVTLTFAAGTNTEKPANVIQEALSQAGIDAELNPVPNTQSGPRYAAGDFESFVSNDFSAKIDPAETVNTYLLGQWGLSNGSPEIAELAAKAANPTLTQDERASLYHEIWDETLQETMYVPICNLTNATISNGRVVGADDMPWRSVGVFDLRHVGMTD